MKRGFCHCLGVLALCVIGASEARGQIVTSAWVTGIVLDPTDRSIADAPVQLVDRRTNHTVTTTTDERGRFSFFGVPVGDYVLAADVTGFARATVDLTLWVGRTVDVRLRLVVAARESVSVAGEASLVEPVRTHIAATIAPAEVDALPLNGRNYLDLALLVPNVSRTTTRSNERFAETSAVPGTGLSIAGQRNLSNTFVVDGLSANDDAADLAGTAFAEEVIREFQVITTGGTAEFGRAAAGVLNVVTRSGTNQLGGRAYGFFRDARWDARNALAARKDPVTQAQFGFTAGGPVRRDRTFFFANVERTHQDKSGVVTVTAAQAQAINRVLADTGYAGPALVPGEFLTGYASTNVFGRVDQLLAGGGRLQVRYSVYDVDSDNARNVGGLNAVSRGTRLENTDHTLAGGWQVPLGTGALSDLRLQWTRSDLAAPPNDRAGPAVAISGVANLGTSSTSPTARALRVLQVADTVAVQRGAHLLKAGADLLVNRATIEFPGAARGSYTFTSLPNLERGVYQQYQQAFGDTRVDQFNPNLGLFVQDEWTLHARVTVNAGVRYDLQWLPDPIALDVNNVSPRIGAAWTTADATLVVRASAGSYFDRIPLRATSNALQRDGERYRVAVLSFGEDAAPVFPHVLEAFPSDQVSAITTIDPDVPNGRSDQMGLQVERALGGVASVSAGYSHVRGRRILMSRNVNVPTLTAAQAASLGVPNLGRPDARFANVSTYEAIGDSWFNGLTLSLHTLARDWGSVRVSYTLSEAVDTAGNAFFSSPQDNFDVAAEKGPSDNDQRHRLVVSGAIGGAASRQGALAALGGVELGYVASYATGVPFNVLAGSDLNGDTSNNDRPPGVGRNSGRQSATSTLDLRLSRTFFLRGGGRLQAMIEAFNVLNHVNVIVVNNTFGTDATPRPGFGRPTLAGDARQLQLGIRWTF